MNLRLAEASTSRPIARDGARRRMQSGSASLAEDGLLALDGDRLTATPRAAACCSTA
ncbi:MAG: hypothetical protein WDM81_00150 [Rhizomicrobium sp.]